MKRTIALWTAALAVLASAGSLTAHHSLAQFDTDTAVWVKGTIVLLEYVNPHSFIFLEEKTASGQSQGWAVEGPSALQFARRGFDRNDLKVGDVIEACGYVTKHGVQTRTVSAEPDSPGLNAATSRTTTGRVLTGEMLVLPDGEKRPWGDYGHHHCLGPDYRDNHTR